MQKLIELVEKGAHEIAEIKRLEIEIGNLVFHSSKSITDRESQLAELLELQFSLVAEEIATEKHISHFIGTLRRKHTGQTVLVVTHQVTYKAFRSLIQGDSVSEIGKYDYTPNCGMAIYELKSTGIEKPGLELVDYDVVGY